MAKLFVYGTLKHLDRSFSPFVRLGIVTSPPIVGVVHHYTLYKGFPGFPMARPTQPSENRIIQGELVTIEQDAEHALARLDRYEGVVTGLYTRETVDVFTERGVEQAFMYVATEETIERARAVEIGSWFSNQPVGF